MILKILARSSMSSYAPPDIDEAWRDVRDSGPREDPLPLRDMVSCHVTHFAQEAIDAL